MASQKKQKGETSLETLKRKTTEQLAIDRHKLLMKMPFIGSLLMRLELVPVRDDRLETAATNGDSIFVDIAFYAKLSPEERLFVLAHEAWHCALLHFARRQNRDRDIFNCAADLEIHFILTREGLKAPFVLPHDPAWQGLSAEEIYAKYKKSSKSNEGQESENIRNTRKGGGFDTHLDKDDTLGKNTSVAAADRCGNRYIGRGSQDDKDDKDDKGGGKGEDVDYSPEIKPGAAERCRERLTSVVQQYQRTRGKCPLGIESVVEKVLEPKIDWRERLAQFVTNCYGGSRRWLPPSRRHVWQGLYMQSSRQERLDAAVAVDTSGSTIGDLPRFFAELGGLLNSFGSYRMTVIQCDAKVQQVEVFDDMAPFPPDYKWRAKGGGGTDFRPVFDYMDKHPELEPNLLIYITDGYGYYPDRAPAFPVMWLVTPDGKIDVPWGIQCSFDNENRD